MTANHRPAVPPETAEERSLTAARAGLSLTPEAAAGLANRYEVLGEVRDVLRAIDVSEHEPSGVFVCRRWETEQGGSARCRGTT